jgi:hypothetical protein
MVTVGYEQARGLRVKHQTADGFSMSVSKTISAPTAKVFQAWNVATERDAWFRDSAKLDIRKATANKSLRMNGAGGKTAVEVMFYAKGTQKCQVVVQERKLEDAKAVERAKKYWGEALENLKEHLIDVMTAKRNFPSETKRKPTGATRPNRENR